MDSGIPHGCLPSALVFFMTPGLAFLWWIS